MISALRLQNFKVFDEQELTIKPLTLLTGLNGTGKSSVLQALLLLRQSHLRGLLGLELLHEDSDQNRHSGLEREYGLALNGELVQIGSAPDVKHEFAGDKDDIVIELEYAGSGNVSWRFNYLSASSFAQGEEARQQRIEQIDVIPLEDAQATNLENIQEIALFTDLFHYLQAERIGPRTSFPMSDYAVRHNQIGSRGEYTVHYLGRYASAPVLEKLHHRGLDGQKLSEEPNQNTLLQQVTSWSRELSPGIRLNVEVFPEVGAAKLGYSVERGQDLPPTQEKNSSNFGFGVTYALSILVAVLSSKPDSLILLENPEAHLHPKGQARLGELLGRAAEGGVQIIVETHSDHILNGIRVATKNRDISADKIAIHYFAREEGHRAYYSIPIDDEGNIERWPEGFFDEYENMLTKLL